MSTDCIQALISDNECKLEQFTKFIPASISSFNMNNTVNISQSQIIIPLLIGNNTPSQLGIFTAPIRVQSQDSRFILEPGIWQILFSFTAIPLNFLTTLTVSLLINNNVLNSQSFSWSDGNQNQQQFYQVNIIKIAGKATVSLNAQVTEGTGLVNISQGIVVFTQVATNAGAQDLHCTFSSLLE